MESVRVRESHDMRSKTIYMSTNCLNLGNGYKNEENWGEVLEAVLTDQGMN